MFGNGFSEYKEDVLEVGDYEVTIANVAVKGYNNGNQYVELTFAVNGHSADCKPNVMILNDRPVAGTLKSNGNPITEKEVKAWDKSMTRFFETFNIGMGDFNFRNWQGKKGAVHCDWQYDSKEPDKKSKQFKQFFCNVKKHNEAANASAPGTVDNATNEILNQIF